MEGSSSSSAEERFPFPEVSILVFENLKSLVSFGSGDFRVQWPSLQEVTVNDCDKIMNSGLGHVDESQFKSVVVNRQAQPQSMNLVGQYFALSDEYSSKDKLDIDDAELIKIVGRTDKDTHFTNLVEFQAKNCGEKLNEFLLTLLERSKRLGNLIIEDCKFLKHVFDPDRLVAKPSLEGNEKYFPLLKRLKLCDLPQLTSIWSKDPSGHFDLGCLQTVDIKKCGSLKNVISPSAAGNLQQLQVLRVHSCQNMEQVVDKETQGLERQKRVIVFLLLEELELMDLQKFTRFHTGNCDSEYPSLKKLRIRNCPRMVSFTTGFASAEKLPVTDGNSFTKLTEIELDACQTVVYVIHTLLLPRFCNLEKLTVRKCDSLTELIQFHDEFLAKKDIHDEIVDEASMLESLMELQLSQLPNLIHVISKDFASTNCKFFKNLQILRVEECNSLTYLFLPFAANSVRLTEIEISSCKALKEIFVTKAAETSGRVSLPHLKCIALENLPELATFSLCTLEFPLETLKITDCPKLKTFLSGFTEMKDDPPAASDNFFENFKSLEKLQKLLITNQVGVEKLWNKEHPSSSIYELEELTLNKSNNLLNVIPFSMVRRLNKLKNFSVDGCEQLIEVFDLEDLPGHGITEILPLLNAFALSNLPSLKHIWNKEPPVPVFQNLVSLQIIDCHGLKKLFSLSTAMHLRQLKLLKLYGCREMEEVLGDGSEGILPEDIVFENVECLVLKDLPGLECFCRRSSTFKWPKLKTVRVSAIPEMKTFSHGELKTDMLKTVYVTFVKKCWRGDLNSTIQYLYEHPAEFEKA